METQKESNTLFKGLILNNETPEEIELKAAKMQAEARELRERQKNADLNRAQQEKEADMRHLREFREVLRKLDGAVNLSTKMDIDQALELTERRDKILEQIAEVEARYGIGNVTEQDKIMEEKSHRSIWPTVWGIIALLVACWGSVVYSGNWILDRYPGAAIYNAVSFQKVVFGFSVFIAEVAGAIIATCIFFPGIGKYFNPFNRDQLDFFTDFKQLTQWQRTLISLLLFFALLLAFVLTVSGKLD